MEPLQAKLSLVWRLLFSEVLILQESECPCGKVIHFLAGPLIPLHLTASRQYSWSSTMCAVDTGILGPVDSDDCVLSK